MTLGKSITSAIPSARAAPQDPLHVAACRSGRSGDSRALAGTHEEAMTNTRSGSPAVASSIQCTPSEPSTLASSCGSETTLVVPQREHGPGELRGDELGGLEVDVGVDEARHEPAPAPVDPLRGAGVAADPRDPTVRHRDVALEPLAGEDAEDLRALAPRGRAARRRGRPRSGAHGSPSAGLCRHPCPTRSLAVPPTPGVRRADARLPEGAPGRTRTCNPPLRRRALCPVELPGRGRASLGP